VGEKEMFVVDPGLHAQNCRKNAAKMHRGKEK
jgi:hypothetical protein